MYFLYVKTHRITGLKYLGYTSRPDPYKYLGSGVRWTRHLKKHGANVDTEILLETTNFDEVKSQGLYYSNLWNIVRDKRWANIKKETGDGGDTSMSPAYKKGIAKRDLYGPKNPMYGGFSKKHRSNLSKVKKGKKPPNFVQWSSSAKGKKYYNNSIVEKRFFENEAPSDWKPGRLQLQCNMCSKLVDYANLKKYHKNCLKEQHQ